MPNTSMQWVPHVEKCLFAIQFLGTHVIIMVVSNLSADIKMEMSIFMDLFIMDIQKTISKGMDFKVLVDIADSDT